MLKSKIACGILLQRRGVSARLGVLTSSPGWALLLALVLPASAQEALPRFSPKLPVLPPVEYDKPYTGALTIMEVPSQDAMRAMCHPAKDIRPLLGCALRHATSCTILVATEAQMKAAGWQKEIVVRHETGHCLGWSGDHAGARPMR